MSKLSKLMQTHKTQTSTIHMTVDVVVVVVEQVPRHTSYDDSIHVLLYSARRPVRLCCSSLRCSRLFYYDDNSSSSSSRRSKGALTTPCRRRPYIGKQENYNTTSLRAALQSIAQSPFNWSALLLLLLLCTVSIFILFLFSNRG